MQSNQKISKLLSNSKVPNRIIVKIIVGNSCRTVAQREIRVWWTVELQFRPYKKKCISIAHKKRAVLDILN